MKKSKLWGLLISAAAAAVCLMPASASAAWEQVDSMGDLNGVNTISISNIFPR